MSKQDTIISIKGRNIAHRDGKYIEGKWGKGCLRILSDTELDDVILQVDLPGEPDTPDGKVLEIVIDKAMLKVYVSQIDVPPSFPPDMEAVRKAAGQ